jgi:1,4-dihydroxy-2-naphthoate octaprenyltransferase
MLVDISDIKKDLNEEEKEIFDKVIKAMNAKSVTVNMLNLAFWAILLYVSFTILPLWAAISLIGIKLAIPVAKAVKYITVAKKLIKDDKDVNKKILSIRLKIANKEKDGVRI